MAGDPAVVAGARPERVGVLADHRQLLPQRRLHAPLSDRRRAARRVPGHAARWPSAGGPQRADGADPCRLRARSARLFLDRAPHPSGQRGSAVRDRRTVGRQPPAGLRRRGAVGRLAAQRRRARLVLGVRPGGAGHDPAVRVVAAGAGDGPRRAVVAPRDRRLLPGGADRRDLLRHRNRPGTGVRRGHRHLPAGGFAPRGAPIVRLPAGRRSGALLRGAGAAPRGGDAAGGRRRQRLAGGQRHARGARHDPAHDGLRRRPGDGRSVVPGRAVSRRGAARPRWGLHAGDRRRAVARRRGGPPRDRHLPAAGGQRLRHHRRWARHRRARRSVGADRARPGGPLPLRAAAAADHRRLYGAGGDRRAPADDTAAGGERGAARLARRRGGRASTPGRRRSTTSTTSASSWRRSRRWSASASPRRHPAPPPPW